MRISKFIAIPNVRKNIAEANETAERKVAFQRGLYLGLTVWMGFVYAVAITYIFLDVSDWTLLTSIDPALVVLPLFAIFTIGFLNLSFGRRSRFDDMVEQKALELSQKERREKGASES